VYEKPKLEKYGSFRELTLIGFSGSADGATQYGNGCEYRDDKGNVYSSCTAS
jgi:hypothetical protein